MNKVTSPSAQTADAVKILICRKHMTPMCPHLYRLSPLPATSLFFLRKLPMSFLCNTTNKQVTAIETVVTKFLDISKLQEEFPTCDFKGYSQQSFEECI